MEDNEPADNEPTKRRKRPRVDPAEAAEKAAAKAEETANARRRAAVNASSIALFEGLVLVRSHECASGYKNVRPISKASKQNLSKPWQCTINTGAGKKKELGRFTTKEEAALCYARHIGAVAAAELDRHYERTLPMTPEAAITAAEAEGLTLRTAPGTLSGYRCVSCSRKKPEHALTYHAHATDLDAPIGSGKAKNLGSFASAEEAALAVARHQRENDPALLPAHAAQEVAAREVAIKAKRKVASQYPKCSRCGELRKGHVCRMGSDWKAANVLVASIAPTGLAAEGLLHLANPNGMEYSRTA